MFKEYSELKEILESIDESSLSLPAGGWFQSIFGQEEKEPVQSSEHWKRLVKAYKTAKGRAEKLRIMQALNSLMKNQNV